MAGRSHRQGSCSAQPQPCQIRRGHNNLLAQLKFTAAKQFIDDIPQNKKNRAIIMGCNRFDLHDCSNSTTMGSRRLEANSDVSGIGVLIGFLATAWTCFIAMVFYYVVTPQESDNMLDRSIHRAIHKVFKRVPSSLWAPASEAVLLALSDQLLVTGLAFIISGYYQAQCGLSVYHWQIITRLVWFASVTHIATLICLERYFEKHRYIWYARVFLMTGLAIMLAIGTSFNGDKLNFYSYAEPIACSFHDHDYRLDFATGWGTFISEAMLVGGLVVRLIQMFSITNRFCGSLFQALRRLRWAILVWLNGKAQKWCRCLQAISLSLVVFVLVVSVSFQSLLDFVRSRTFGLLWLLFSLIWGTIQLFFYRIRVMNFYNRSQEIEDEGVFEEDTWSFGQLVPVFMLLVPLLLMMEGCSDMIYKCKTEYKNNDGSYSSFVPHTESQEQLESSFVDYNRDTRLPQDRANQNTVVPSQAMVAHGLSFPMQTSAEPLLNRISSLCQRQFHSEQWYLDNMRLAMAAMTGVACFLFVKGQGDSFTTFALVLAIFVASFVCLALIPLCGILDSLGSKQLAKRYPLSVVRLAVDPGKAYRVLRYIYFAFCPISAIGYGVILSVHGDYISMVPMFVWTGFVYLLIIIASLMVPVSICRQLYSRKTVEVL